MESLKEAFDAAYNVLKRFMRLHYAGTQHGLPLPEIEELENVIATLALLRTARKRFDDAYPKAKVQLEAAHAALPYRPPVSVAGVSARFAHEVVRRLADRVLDAFRDVSLCVDDLAGARQWIDYTCPTIDDIYLIESHLLNEYTDAVHTLSTPEVTTVEMSSKLSADSTKANPTDKKARRRTGKTAKEVDEEIRIHVAKNQALYDRIKLANKKGETTPASTSSVW